MKIIQFSDAHLESPLSILPREKAELRRSELRLSLCHAIRTAGEERCPIALVPGDLFDQNFASFATLHELAQAFAAARDTLFFISPGNHDPIGPRSPYMFWDWPENVYIFRSTEMEEVEVTVRDGDAERVVSVWGCAGLPRPYDKAPLEGFTVRDRGRLNLGCVHGFVTGARAVPYGPIAKDEIAGSGLDYLALGHVHGQTPLAFAGAVPYAYSGCLEGRGFDECGPKGLLFVEIEKGKCSCTFQPTSLRQVHRLVVDITGAMTSEAAAARCADAVASLNAGKLKGNAPTEAEVARLTIADLRSETGAWRGYLPGRAGVLPGEMVSERDLVRFELVGELAAEAEIDGPTVAALAGQFFYCEVEQLAERRVDYGKLAADGTLTGEFVRECLARIDAEEDPHERRTLELALRYGLEALSGKKVSADGCH